MSDKRPFAAVCLVWTALLCSNAFCADWPAYKAGPARSSVTGEQLVFPLSKSWIYEPAQAPSPAWPEPGRAMHRMDFDYAFQPVLADGMMYFGSSADDTIRALDAATGALRWRFTTGGPIRFAPQIADGRCYVGSDDGFAYCLDAATGRLLWRFHAAQQNRQLIGNGRMISRWPCRTGMLVADGTAYVTAGMWPSEGIYVYALDARSGKQIWCNNSSGDMYMDLPHPGASAFSGVAPQGYLLASGDVLLVPTGRSVPAAFDRGTGRLLYYRPASTQWNGGAWATIAGDLYFNPKHVRAPDVDIHLGEGEAQPGDGMAAYSLRTGQRLLELPDRHLVLVAGRMIYAAGSGQIQAIDLERWRQTRDLNGSVKWTAPHPRAYCLAMAGQSLLVGGGGSVSAFRAGTGKTTWSAELDGEVRGIAVAQGRLVAATDKGTIVCFERQQVQAPTIAAREKLTWKVGAPGKYMDLAKSIIERTGVSKGYALLVGESDSRLAMALCLQSDLHVINVLRGTAEVAREREALLTTDLYGSRLVVQGLEDLAHLPYAPYFANLIVVSAEVEHLSGKELYRVLRPCGGVLCFAGVSNAAAKKLIAEGDVPGAEVRLSGAWPMVVRGRLPGAGEWRQQWADGGRTGTGGESRLHLPFDLLWFGGPGPDRMMSRHWATSTPLSVNGSVFVTGQHHVIAFDAYNGRELWCREIRGVGRKGAIGNSANFAADDESIYAAVRSCCFRLDQATGKTLAVYNVPDALVAESATAFQPSSMDVEWPTTWQVLGPLPKQSAPLPGKHLKEIPKEFVVDGKKYTVRPLQAVGGVLEFTYLYGGYGFKPLEPGQKPRRYPRGGRRRDPASEGKIAYAFAKISCPKAGRLNIGAGSDWWMQWYLDGKPIYDTLTNGNRKYPFAITNHVFSANVSAGEHVLAVMVKAGGLGWCLTSAGGARYDPQLRYVPPGERGAWGYLSVADDLVLGSYIPPGAPRSEGTALFALDKKDGSDRWTYRARNRLFSTGIALGDGRAFIIDATSADSLERAKRRGKKIENRRALVALDVADGSELWRQDDVPQTWYYVQYSRGVVVINSNAAYDAPTGRKLWQREVLAARAPIIYHDWIIAQPQAYDLRTGAPRMARDILTGVQRPWKFARAYGCGPIAGCETMLFFRSGTAGFFEFAREGTSTFGAVRPGCSQTMIPANGLMIAPEGSSGCTCGYNFQTSLALIPAVGRKDFWDVYQGERTPLLVKHVSLNLGAPGDRRDAGGTAWLGFPRPIMPGACPAPVSIVMRKPRWYYKPDERLPITETDRPWLYGSGLRGQGKIIIDSTFDQRVEAPTCEQPPVIDGVLDDSCWKRMKPVRFEHYVHLLEPQIRLHVCRDADNLYFAYRRKAAMHDSRPVPFVARQTGDNAKCWLDDDVELFISDKTVSSYIQLGVSCAGGRFAFRNVKENGRYQRDPQWHGKWSQGVRKESDHWSAEMAIPFQTLTEAGIDVADLQFNLVAWQRSGDNIGMTFLKDPSGRSVIGRSGAVLAPIVKELPPLPKRNFTVRLHFAEPDDVKVGERVFDVRLQGKLVLKDFDVVREAGGPNRAVAKEFTGIEGKEALTVTITRSGLSEADPVLCGLEVLAQE